MQELQLEILMAPTTLAQHQKGKGGDVKACWPRAADSTQLVKRKRKDLHCIPRTSVKKEVSWFEP